MSKNQTIGLEIKSIKFLKPTTPLSSVTKKAKTSQDDSVLNYATSSKATTNNEYVEHFPFKFPISKLQQIKMKLHFLYLNFTVDDL